MAKNLYAPIVQMPQRSKAKFGSVASFGKGAPRRRRYKAFWEGTKSAGGVKEGSIGLGGTKKLRKAMGFID